MEPVKGVCTSETKLHGKVVLITGGNTGIGLETARDLARRGAKVIIASRNVEKSIEAVEDIIKTTGNKNVEHFQLNLSNFKNVRQFAEDFNKNYDRLDILVNNAGCGGLKNRLTKNGIDVVMQVNYFSHFLLTSLLMDKLEASKPSRIVNVSSVLHHFGNVTQDSIDGCNYKTFWRSYCTSKLCQVLWTRALAKRLPPGVTVNALHPGIIATDIYKRAEIFKGILMFYIRVFFKNVVEGAQTTIDVCVNEELENISGLYFQDCKLCDISSSAQNDDLAEMVWNQSTLLTKEYIS